MSDQQEGGTRATCPICQIEGQQVVLREKPGRLICDECDTIIPVAHEDPIEVLVHEMEEKLRARHPALYNPGVEGLPRRLDQLERDAWWMIATERYNSGIILLGTLVEATLQEVLYVHRYEYFWGPLGNLIAYLRALGLVDPALLGFADSFRDYIRNKWQHQKVHEITAGASIHGVKLSVDLEEGLGDLLEQVKAVKSGEIPLARMTPQEEPGIRGAVKDAIDQQLAVPLFNKIWLWVLFVATRYLRQGDYRELHKRYGKEEPKTVKWRGGQRKEISLTIDPGAHIRLLRMPVYDRFTGRLGGT